MWSNTALAELAARQVPVMVLGPAFTPVAVVLPLDGHHAQAERFRAQADAALPLRKQAWATLVRHKIAAQADALDHVGAPSERLRRLLVAVRSGDPDNREAQAAQAYWPLMMGREFRRGHAADGANAMLNYGYAVLRAGTARAIVAAGLHPSLSLHHKSGGDALALADDLMEPFRPTVDLIVHRLIAAGRTGVEDSREDLVACLNADFPTRNGATPLSQALVRLAQSLASSFLDRKLKLDFPSRPIPEDLEEDDDV
tara:strand:+ start:29 stop:796 length:768 start_codon:yes stop_codon:yes gene_type:complete